MLINNVQLPPPPNPVFFLINTPTPIPPFPVEKTIFSPYSIPYEKKVIIIYIYICI